MYYFSLIRRSQMITKDDYDFITSYDSTDAAGRAAILNDKRQQAAKTFLSLLEHVSKDQTVQYVLVLIDDMLQVRWMICYWASISQKR